MEYNEQQSAHGGSQVGVLGFMTTSAFWFQPMQNWQSEFSLWSPAWRCCRSPFVNMALRRRIRLASRILKKVG
jgi:hypothetical protein